MPVSIKYVGSKPQGVRDVVAGTLIQWGHGESRPVPEWAVSTLLAHPGIWARDTAAPEAETLEAELIKPPVDESETKQTEDAIQDLQVNAMDKDALEVYAKQKFGIDIDKRRAVGALRIQVQTLLAQYGVA